ncbi:hypothetical protein AAC387_Pa01g0500 [Persea americana]
MASWPFWSIPLHAILLISLSAAAATTPLQNETDRLALLALKAEITDDPLQALSSWNDSLHFCKWRGVTCGRTNQRPSTPPRTDSMDESLTNSAICFGFSNLTCPLTLSKEKSRQL